MDFFSEDERKLKRIVLLHSNDIHADVLSKDKDGTNVGGMVLLSGYLNKVRSEDENVIYLIAGDVFNGSVIDSDYNGMSTVLMLNRLSPDAVCIGNHELDYGISHSLFAQRCADYPYINANIYIRFLNKRLFEPYTIITRDGMNFLVVGLITDNVASGLKADSSVGRYIEIRNPLKELELILDTYDSDQIDAVILLTHVGFEEDKNIAAQYKNPKQISAVVGGHSHTLLETPVHVNGIPIVQVGCGTHNIGRWEIYYDAETKKLDHSVYKVEPINEETCPVDKTMNMYVDILEYEADLKYKKVLCRLNRELENNVRNRQTPLGSFLADILCSICGNDIFLLNSATLRSYKIPAAVTLEEIVKAYPYSNQIYEIKVDGNQLKSMIEYQLSHVDFDNIISPIFHFSKGLVAEFSRSENKLISITFNGTEVNGDTLYRIGMIGYTFSNVEKYFGIKSEDIEKNGKAAIVATDDQKTIIEYLNSKSYIEVPEDSRIIIKD